MQPTHKPNALLQGLWNDILAGSTKPEDVQPEHLKPLLETVATPDIQAGQRRLDQLNITREALMRRYGVDPNERDKKQDVTGLYDKILRDPAIPDEVKDEVREQSRVYKERMACRAAVLDMHEAWGLPIPNKGADNWTAEGATLSVDIQGNTCSRLHKLSDTIQKDAVVWLMQDDHEANFTNYKLATNLQTFVISHDWTKLLDKEVLEGDFMLPYDRCAFEFRVSNRTLIILVGENIEGKRGFMSFYETKAGAWVNIGGIGQELWESFIRTICVMLETEVAVTTPHRADHKLNVKRAKKGEVPVYDFHTLSIARRHRTEGLRPGVPTGHHKRLHFVRGHWRHYDTHKTWIKWHLRGDETLGFADKDYKV